MSLDTDPRTGLPQGWTLPLEPGERILWHGRPDPRADPAFNLYRPVQGAQRVALALLLFGLPLVFLLVFRDMMARSPVVLTAILALVLPILAGGWYLVLGGKARVDAFWRRRQWYLLTDRRAIVATRGPVRSVASWPVAAWNALAFDGRSPGTIEIRRVRVGRRSRNQQVDGFVAIRDAARVFALMQRLKSGNVP